MSDICTYHGWAGLQHNHNALLDMQYVVVCHQNQPQSLGQHHELATFVNIPSDHIGMIYTQGLHNLHFLHPIHNLYWWIFPVLLLDPYDMLRVEVSTAGFLTRCLDNWDQSRNLVESVEWIHFLVLVYSSIQPDQPPLYSLRSVLYIV